MKNNLNISNTNTSFENYFITNNISNEVQQKLSEVNFLAVPARYSENEYYFAQETIDFLKFCRQHSSEYNFDILADDNAKIRSLHSFDIWMPIIYIAEMVLLPIAINLVSEYINDKLKGREKEDAQVEMTFIVKRIDEEKTIHYSGDAKTFKKTFEKIDINNM